MKFGCIYKTRNSLNGKIYIGKHFGDYDKRYLGSGLYLCRAVEKYGKELFITKAIIENVPEAVLDEFEIFLIAKYREILGKENVYNISDGGEGGGGPKFHKREVCNCPFCRNMRGEVGASSHPGNQNGMYGKTGSFAGTIWINKGQVEKPIKIEVLEQSLVDGWQQGRKGTSGARRKGASRHKPALGTVWINNDIVSKYVKREVLVEFLESGWKLGRIRWAKGKPDV